MNIKCSMKHRAEWRYNKALKRLDMENSTLSEVQTKLRLFDTFTLLCVGYGVVILIV